MSRRGSRRPSARRLTTTCRAEPSWSKRRNTHVTASRTASSGGDDHVVIAVVVQPGGQRQPQLAAGGLGAQPFGHPCPQQVQFAFREGALEAQDEPVVIAGGMVDPV